MSRISPEKCLVHFNRQGSDWSKVVPFHYGLFFQRFPVNARNLDACSIINITTANGETVSIDMPELTKPCRRSCQKASRQTNDEDAPSSEKFFIIFCQYACNKKGGPCAHVTAFFLFRHTPVLSLFPGRRTRGHKMIMQLGEWMKIAVCSFPRRFTAGATRMLALVTS